MKITEVAMSSSEAKEILGLSNDDVKDPDKIKAAYRKLSLTNHPDVGGSVEQMQRINAAYDVLKRNRNLPDMINFEELKNKHRQLTKIILKNLEERFHPETFANYFENIIGKHFTYTVATSEENYSYYTGARLIANFVSDDEKTKIDLKFQVSTHGVDVNKNYLGLDGMILDTYIETSVLHNLRKHKMKQKNYEFSKDAAIFADPSILFPAKKLKKMIEEETTRKISKRDFVLSFEKELGMKYIGDNTYEMPLGDNLRILIYRVTILRMGTWGINGIYSGFRRVDAGPTVTFFEDAETLEYIISEFSKLKNMTDVSLIAETLDEIVARYKLMKQ